MRHVSRARIDRDTDIDIDRDIDTADVIREMSAACTTREDTDITRVCSCKLTSRNTTYYRLPDA